MPDTVGVTVIAIATGEPLGAYHLRPFGRLAADAGLRHLVPEGELQGTGGRGEVELVETTRDQRLVETADLVVITGGVLNPWTAEVARRRPPDRPIVYSQLATTAASPSAFRVRIDGFTAISPNGAQAVAQHFGIPMESIAITGTPELDDLPKHEPRPGRVLLLAGVLAEQPDLNHALARIGRRLVAADFDVVVRPHPREQAGAWSGFLIDDSHSAAEAASISSYAVALSGSGVASFAALGVPVMTVDTGERDPWIMPLTSGVIARPEDADVQLFDAEAPSLRTVDEFVGPVGGSAERVVQAWQRHLAASPSGLESKLGPRAVAR